jgi:hypothetical protein
MRRLLAPLAVAVLAGCTQYQAGTNAVASLGQDRQAVLLVKVGPVALDDVPSANVFGGKRQVASILVAPFNPPVMPGGRIASPQVLDLLPGQFPIPNAFPGGFLSKTVPAGDYVIKGLYRIQRWACFNEGSVAFHVSPGQVIYLGELNANAYLRRIAREAEQDATVRAHTHDGQFGIGTFYSGNEALDRSDQGWRAPDPADIAPAQAFIQTTYGSNAPVVPAQFHNVNWLTQPQRYNIDSCGSTPTFIKSAVLKLTATTDAGLVMVFGTPPADPRPELPGVPLQPQPDGSYLWKLNDQTTLFDNTCHAVTPSQFIQTARAKGDLNVQFTTYQAEDDSLYSPPQVHVFSPHSSDVADCSDQPQAGLSSGGGVVIVPQFHFHK